MICPKCGREIPDNSKLCKYCGAPISEIRIDLGGYGESASDSRTRVFSGTDATDATKILPERDRNQTGRIPQDGTEYGVTGYADRQYGEEESGYDSYEDEDYEDEDYDDEDPYYGGQPRSGAGNRSRYGEKNRAGSRNGSGHRNYEEEDRSSRKNKKKKGGNGKLVAILLLIAGVLIAALLFWWWSTHRTDNSTPVVVNTSSTDSEDLSKYENADLNGVDSSTVTAEGKLLLTSDGQGYLQMSPAVSVFADTAEGTQMYLESVRSLTLLPSGSSTISSISGYDGKNIQVTGVLSINEDQEPCLTLFQVVLLDATETPAAVKTETPTPTPTETETPTPTVSPLTPDKTSAVTAEPTATPTPTETETPTPTPTEKPSVTYRIVTEDCTWEQAFQEARNAGGKLAVIDSEEEYQTLLSQIKEAGDTNMLFYVGGRRDDTDMNYYWVNSSNQITGDPISGYWASGEPSATEEETKANGTVLLLGSDGLHSGNDNYLSANEDQKGKIGYIIEIDS